MSSNLLFAPLGIPFSFAVAMIVFRGRSRTYRKFSLLGASLHLVSAIWILLLASRSRAVVLQVGGWTAPYGISLVADLFSSIMLVLTGIISVSACLYALGSREDSKVRLFSPLMQFMIMGVSGAFLSGDVFNLYVWFEVLLIASFVLMGLGRGQHRISGAVKYLSINLLASVSLLSAVALLYGSVGTLNLADIALKVRQMSDPGAIRGTAFLFLFAFGIKAAVFPLFFWLPASYPNAPPAMAAVFAGLLTKVGVYALIRVFTLLFTSEPGITHGAILWIAVASMVTGVLGAVSQNEIRRILSFHIISQIGYMVLGLGFFTRTAIAGSVFYLIHHILVKANLFLVGGLVQRFGGTTQLKQLGGMAAFRPAVGLLFLVPALSLAGVPPFSGFFAKFILVREGFEKGYVASAFCALGVGLLTLMSMTKIWEGVFWGEGRPAVSGTTPAVWMVGGSAMLGILTLSITLFTDGVYTLALRTADQLLDWKGYASIVLNREIP